MGYVAAIVAGDGFVVGDVVHTLPLSQISCPTREKVRDFSICSNVLKYIMLVHLIAITLSYKNEK